MNRLFHRLRKLVEHSPAEAEESLSAPALPGFDNRIEVLCRHAEQAAAYETDLHQHLAQVQERLDQLQERVESALDVGEDRKAYEFVRLAARIRPQYTLLRFELRAFRAVSSELILRVDKLMAHLEEARALAQDGSLSPVATRHLDETLTRLTRYFVMLERVATARRKALPERLAQQLTAVIDDRQLDLELARYILNRRRALGPGKAGR